MLQNPSRKRTGQFRSYHPNKFRGYLLMQGYEPPTKFHSVIGMNDQIFAKKLRGATMWRFPELVKIKYHLRMNDHDFCEIFFDTAQDDIIGVE